MSGSVTFLQSPLAATGRIHTCPEEPQVLICQVEGSYIRWTFDSNYRANLFHYHNVNTVRIVSEQHGIRAVLIGNDAIPESTGTVRRLRSALIIESSSALRGDVHNISCSSDSASQVHQTHVAGEFVAKYSYILYLYRLYHEVQVSTLFTHRGPKTE